jgi:hypothetical protein
LSTGVPFWYQLHELGTVLELTRINPKVWRVATKPLVSSVLIYGRTNRTAYILYLLYVLQLYFTVTVKKNGLVIQICVTMKSRYSVFYHFIKLSLLWLFGYYYEICKCYLLRMMTTNHTIFMTYKLQTHKNNSVNEIDLMTNRILINCQCP